MNISFRLVAAVAVLAAPQPAAAWGYEGHRVVAAIARSYLTPTTQAKIDALLASDTDTLEPHDMLSAATWPDTWRKTHPETAEWHFADVELDHPDVAAACFGFPVPATPASAGPARDCIINRVNVFIAELSDPKTPQPERIVALKYVLHLVGDLHQPLHASDDHNKGGNCVLLGLGGSRTTNLHSFWDTGAIREMSDDPLVVAASLRAEITPAKRAAWERGDPKTWAAESWNVAKTTAYTIGSPSGCQADPAPITPPAGYDAAVRAAVALQLERAGVRLANVLNKALAKG